MTVLVTGATGTVGTQVVAHLVRHGADVRALVRDPNKAKLPVGVQLVKGDMLDVDAMRKALHGVTTLFLLNAVAADEFTQALITLNLAREAGVKSVVYFSVLHGDIYVDVPHFAGKFAVERMIEQTGMHATILRPAYFMNNDANVLNVIVDHGVYPMPIGDKGLAMVDVRDIGEVAAAAILRREHSSNPKPLERIDIVGPDKLTGPQIAAIWSDVLGRQIAYGGNDAAAFEQSTRQFAPSWLAYDMRKMAERFQSDGMAAEPNDLERLAQILGKPLRSYRDFAAELAANSKRR